MVNQVILHGTLVEISPLIMMRRKGAEKETPKITLVLDIPDASGKVQSIPVDAIGDRAVQWDQELQIGDQVTVTGSMSGYYSAGAKKYFPGVTAWEISRSTNTVVIVGWVHSIGAMQTESSRKATVDITVRQQTKGSKWYNVVPVTLTGRDAHKQDEDGWLKMGDVVVVRAHLRGREKRQGGVGMTLAVDSVQKITMR